MLDGRPIRPMAEPLPDGSMQFVTGFGNVYPIPAPSSSTR